MRHLGAGVDESILLTASKKKRQPTQTGSHHDARHRSHQTHASWAEEIGADAVQMSAGYYYASSDEDCLRFFRAVHDATSRIGIMIYNTHWEGYNLSLEQVARLAELPRCVSLKWSTPDGGYSYVRGVHRFADRFAVVDNQGLAVMNHMLGGTGFITHLATVWPEHQVEMWK